MWHSLSAGASLPLQSDSFWPHRNKTPAADERVVCHLGVSTSGVKQLKDCAGTALMCFLMLAIQLHYNSRCQLYCFAAHSSACVCPCVHVSDWQLVNCMSSTLLHYEGAFRYKNVESILNSVVLNSVLISTGCCSSIIYTIPSRVKSNTSIQNLPKVFIWVEIRLTGGHHFFLLIKPFTDPFVTCGWGHCHPWRDHSHQERNNSSPGTT